MGKRNDKMITSYLKKKKSVEYIFYMNCIDINYIYIKKKPVVNLKTFPNCCSSL